MISLRSFTTLTTVVAVALSLSGCADGTSNPLSSSALRPSSASLNTTVTGTIDSRVLLDKSGNAILEVHTGTFVDATNTGTDAGTLSSLTYTVKNGTKTVTTHSVSFSNTTSRYFVHLNLCQSTNDDDDDDGSSAASSCNAHWLPAYQLTVTANLKGIGSGGKSSGTASGTATVMYLPDVDLTQQALSIVGAGGTLSPASSVTPSVPTTFSVPFPANKPIVNGPLGNGSVPNTVGVQTACLVMVDGLPQLPFPSGVYNKYTNPNAFGYVGDVTQTITAGTATPCQFTLSLPAGTHKITVSAIVLYPGDYDITNNTTASFTVTAASGPPDIAAAALQQQASTGGALVALGSVPVIVGTPINLVQWVSSVSGPSVGPVACTLTLTNTSVVPNTSVTLNGTAPSSSASCVMPITFAAAGAYTITSVVTPPSGFTDPNLANNTVTNSLIVASGPASASVTIGDITFVNPYKSNAVRTLAGAAPAADTVHAGDLITYTADINIGSLVNTSAVNVTCHVMEGTNDLDLAGRITWVTGPTLPAVFGQKACVFKLAFDETDNLAHNHTITVSVTTPGSTNSATTGTSFNGTIADIVLADVAAGPVKRVGNGNDLTTIISLDTVKQAPTVTIQTVVSNPNTHATKVDCAITANALLQAQSVGTTTGVSISAGGSATCQFKLNASTIGSFPLSISVSPSTGAPVDPNLANNAVNATLTVLSTGAFTSINLQSVNFDQEWYNPIGALALPVASLDQQHVDINQLALLIIPAQEILGDFTLQAHVVNGTGTDSTAYPVATISGQVHQSTSGARCTDVAAPAGSAFANPPVGFPSQITYAADICSAPAQHNGLDGFQSITVDFTQSLRSAIPNPAAQYVLGVPSGGSILVRIDLFFTLVGGAQDHVSATIKMPIPAPHDSGINSMDQKNRLWTQLSAAASVIP